MRRNALAGALAAGLAVALGLAATYPALRFWDTHFIGGGDTAQNAWNLWWVGEALRAGVLWPSWTPWLYQPDGVSLAYHPLSVPNGWLSAPALAAGLSLPATYNLLILFKFAATALGLYAVVAHISHSRPAGALAAVWFTYAPARLSRVAFGNLEMASTEALPWLVWGWLKLAETRRWRYAALAAAALALTGWFSLTLALGAGLLLALTAVFQWPGAPDRPGLLRRWAATAALAGGLLLPAVLPMLRDYAAFQDQADQTEAASANSADLLGYLLPDNAALTAHFAGNPAEKQVFPGYVALALTVVVVARAWTPAVRVWLGAAGLLAVLSLGPVLHVAGQTVWPWMPYWVLLKLPLIGFGRTPDRLGILAALALAVGLGLGWAQLERRWPRLSRAAPWLGLLIFVEFLRLPMPLDGRLAALPPYYAAAVWSGPILDVPVDVQGAQGPAAEYMLYQTVHGQPIVGGYLSRTPGAGRAVFDRPLVYALRARLYGDAAPWTFDPAVLAGGAADLTALAVRHVVVHKDFLSPADAAIVTAALTTVLAAPEFEDDRLAVWRVP